MIEYEMPFADFDWNNPKVFYNSDGQVVRLSYPLKETTVKFVIKDFELGPYIVGPERQTKIDEYNGLS